MFGLLQTYNKSEYFTLKTVHIHAGACFDVNFIEKC